jgi:hypothetical protein
MFGVDGLAARDAQVPGTITRQMGQQALLHY